MLLCIPLCVHVKWLTNPSLCLPVENPSGSCADVELRMNTNSCLLQQILDLLYGFFKDIWELLCELSTCMQLYVCT